MRLLHTSDWHLGRTLHRESLHGHQAAFLDHLVDVVRTESVDAVLVAGDVFDRAIPPIAAIELYDDTLRRLAGLGVAVVVTAGNHDSAVRLGVHERLLETSRVFVRTRPERVAEPVLLPGAALDVAVYPLPYLDPASCRSALGLPDCSNAVAVTAAMDLVRADLAGRAAGTRAVVVSHAFVTGGSASDSERDLSIGGVGNVPVDAYAGMDYVALGHLHGPQRLAEHVRYSGSPLAYSFSEVGQHKGCLLVDVDRAGVRATHVPAPVPRRLSRLRGRIDDLLAGAQFAAYEADWLEITLLDQARPAEPLERLRRRFPGTLLLRFEPHGASPSTETSYRERIAGRSDLQIVVGFVEHVRQTPATPAEVAWLQAALAAADAQEREAAPPAATPDPVASLAPALVASALAAQTDAAIGAVLPDPHDTAAALAAAGVRPAAEPSSTIPLATGTEG